MYFPYLRGKQFELIALREFAEQYPDTAKIVPIIEPVKSTFNGLNTAAEVMFEKRLKFALVLNPTDGDFKRIRKDILLELPVLSQIIPVSGFLHFYFKITLMRFRELFKTKD